jgi:hypothetical protein
MRRSANGSGGTPSEGLGGQQPESRPLCRSGGIAAHQLWRRHRRIGSQNLAAAWICWGSLTLLSLRTEGDPCQNDALT